MSVSYKIYLTIPQQFSKVYTLIGHSNDVNIFITQEETRRAAGEWFHCKVLNILRQFYRQVVYNPEKIVVDLYFTTFSVFDALCHHVPLRFFFFFGKARVQVQTNIFIITSFPWPVLFVHHTCS